MLRHTPSIEPMTGFEPVTSSLPRKCSTTELHRRDQKKSGKRDSNPRPSAWKADALSTELFPQNIRGRRWIRTTEVVRQQIYSLPHLATLVFALEPAIRKSCLLHAGILSESYRSIHYS